MALETAQYINSLDISNPTGLDARVTVDDHIRLLKASLKRTFTAVTGEVAASHTELNYTMALSSTAQDQLNLLKTGKLDSSATSAYAISANYANQAGSAVNAFSATFATSASFAANASTASYAISAAHSVSANRATTALAATSAHNANSAVYAFSATNATTAVYSQSTGYYSGPVSAGQVDDASAGGAGVIELATNAEVSAGSSSALAVTPAGLLSGLGASKANPGWIRLPSGLILQWSTSATVSSGSGTWVASFDSFPISFPSAVLNVWAVLDADASSISSGYGAEVLVDLQSCSTSTLVAYIRRSQNNGTFALNYLAIGY